MAVYDHASIVYVSALYIRFTSKLFICIYNRI